MIPSPITAQCLQKIIEITNIHVIGINLYNTQLILPRTINYISGGNL